MFQLVILMKLFKLIGPMAIAAIFCAASPTSDNVVPLKATRYASIFEGRTTALGQKFSNSLMTVATTLEKYLGKRLVLESNGRRASVLCNDKMHPRLRGKVAFDLSSRAMKVLSGKKNLPGEIYVTVVDVQNE